MSDCPDHGALGRRPDPYPDKVSGAALRPGAIYVYAR